MNATELMDTLRVDALKSIARKVGLPKTISRKTELVAALNQFMNSNPAGFLDRLDSTERDFLAEAVYNDNRVNLSVFSAKYDVDSPNLSPWNKDCSLINLVIAHEYNSPEATVPQTIADMLRPLLKKPVAPKPVTCLQLPEKLELNEENTYDVPSGVRPIQIYSGERTALFELKRVLQLVQGSKVRIQPKSGRPTPATERAIAASLVVPDFNLELPEEDSDQDALECGSVRAHAWGVLVQQCGWCKASGETLTLTKQGQKFLQDPSPASFREGVQQLVRDNKFDELQRVNHIRGQTGKARRWMSHPSERRGAIFDSLAEWPANEWLAFDEAYRFVNACGHLYSVTEEPMSLYMCDQQYGYLDDGDGIDRQYLRVLLFESLATLGIVDVAYTYPHYLWPELGGNWGAEDMDYCGRYDGLLYVRLNALGQYVLGVANDYTPPPAEKRNLFTVLPNREIAVAGGEHLLPGDVSMLELFAQKRSDRVWRIDQRLILDYLDEGGSLDDILRFMTENAADIPETVRVLFDDLAAKKDAILKTEEARLIEFADPAVSALVVHDSKAGKLCRPAGDRHIVVAKSDERALRTALKKLGYILPR